MTDLELSRRERKKEETKERIFKVACKLFRDKGFEDTTIDEIAERADVAKGTFFNYFPRKEAVLGFLSEMRLEEAEQDVDAIIAAKGPAASKICEMFVQFAGFYEEDPELGRHLIVEAARLFHDGCDSVCLRWNDLGVRVITHLQANGELRDDVNAAKAHEILAGVYHDTTMRWATPDVKPFPLKDELRTRLNLVIEGLGSR